MFHTTQKGNCLASWKVIFDYLQKCSILNLSNASKTLSWSNSEQHNLQIFTKKTWKPFFNKIMVNVITDAYVVVAGKNEPWKLFLTSTPNSTKIPSSLANMNRGLFSGRSSSVEGELFFIFYHKIKVLFNYLRKALWGNYIVRLKYSKDLMIDGFQ